LYGDLKQIVRDVVVVLSVLLLTALMAAGGIH
jgi:hypothetical protein